MLADIERSLGIMGAIHLVRLSQSSERNVTMAEELSERATELLTHLATVAGCDIWSFDQAQAGRELESVGLVRIVKAREKVPAHLRQPYYGIKIKAAGRQHLIATDIVQRTPWPAAPQLEVTGSNREIFVFNEALASELADPTPLVSPATERMADILGCEFIAKPSWTAK